MSSWYSPPPAEDTRWGSSRTVLVVVEDELVRDLIASGLRHAGCYPLPAVGLEQARRVAAQVLPDVVIVDAGSGSTPAAQWAHELAQAAGDGRVRTVFLTEGGTSPLSADLCVRKPIATREFMRSVLGLLRPGRRPHAADGGPPEAQTLRRGNLEVDRELPGARVLRDGRWHTIDLHRAEHRLLLALMASAPRPLDREVLRSAAWGESLVSLRTVDQNVHRLRRALERAGASAAVQTVAGLGYRLDPSSPGLGSRPSRPRAKRTAKPAHPPVTDAA